jgi:hypothetical protein
MGWGASQWVRFTKEQTFGVYDSGASSGDIWWARLHGNSAFTMRPDVSKTRKIIRSADGGNRRRQVVNARTVYGGKLVTPFYPSQANWLLSWASTLTNNNLSSYTADFYDGVRTRRYLGNKVDQLALAGDDSSDYYTATLDLTGQTTADSDPTLAQPDDSVFPTENPWKFTETRGLITLGGTPITLYKAFSLTIKNMLRGKFNEYPYISSLYYTGRDIDYRINPEYLVPDWRSYFEAQTALTIQAGFNRVSPSHALTLDFKTNSYLADLPPEDLPLDDASYTELGFESFYDQGVGSDFSFTAS